MRLPTGTLVAALPLALSAGDAPAKTVWLCKPGLPDNPCLDTRTATVVEADGSTGIERGGRVRRPKIDCFYLDVNDFGAPSDQRLRVTESLGPTWGLHLVGTTYLRRR